MDFKYLKNWIERWLVYGDYYLHAQTRYCLDSPFMHNCLETVIEHELDETTVKKLKKYRTELLSDKRLIPDIEFSSRHQQAGKTVAQMTRKAAASKSHTEFLCKLSNFFRPKRILELGSCTGLSAMALHLGHPEAKIISIEGNPFLHQVCREKFCQLGIDRVTFHNDLFQNYLLRSDDGPFDLVYLDGDHASTSVEENLSSLSQHCNREAILILDDIHWSLDMYKGWKRIIQLEDVQASIEFCRIGILFKSTAVTPMHFRYIPWIFKPWKVGLFR